MSNERMLTPSDQTTEFMLYTAPDGKVAVEVFLHNETIRLTQKRMAELFDVGVSAISKHLKNIFESGELVENSVLSILETTAADGKRSFHKLLERAVSGFFDSIEGIIKRRQTFTMEAFADSVNKFLEFNEYKVLEGYGSISRKQAEEKAFAEYGKFNRTQKVESDFDRVVKGIEGKKKG